MNNVSDEEKVPLFPSWKWWYLLVLANLVLLILLFTLISRIFS
jgi:hypothetical protein